MRLTRKSQKKVNMFIVIFCFLIMIAEIAFGFYLGILYFKTNESIKEFEQEQEIIEKIRAHYHPNVITTKKTDLYEKEEDKYNVVGSIEKNVELELAMTESINIDTKYFKVANMDYYVSYKDVKLNDEVTEIDHRYKSYVPFNKNVVTSDVTNFYDGDNLIFTINESMSLPIIMNDDRYYVDFNDRLLSIKKENGVTEIDANNTSSETASQLATIAYHFFYEKGVHNDCDQIICHSLDQVRSHFQYLNDNNFFTMNTKEMELWVTGKIRLPKNSLLITIDDGWTAERVIPVLEEYKINATLFLVTSWYLPKDFQSEYLETASHSDNLHVNWVCNGGNQGGALLCSARDTILNDLKLTREKLNGSTAFCYPFYDYNNYAISLLKEAGFTIAFAGGNRKVKLGNDLMIIPRYTLLSSTSVNRLAEIVN